MILSVRGVMWMLKYTLIGASGIALSFYEVPWGLGWLLGWLCLSILAFFRERFYTVLLSDEAFRTGQYIGYIIFVFAILWLPLGLAFVFPNVINAFALAASYLIDRLFKFVKGSAVHAN